MNLHEIKKAVRDGHTVCWKQLNYVVVVDQYDQWFILCTTNNNAVGLTHADGITMNENMSDFYIYKVVVNYNADMV